MKNNIETVYRLLKRTEPRTPSEIAEQAGLNQKTVQTILFDLKDEKNDVKMKIRRFVINMDVLVILVFSYVIVYSIISLIKETNIMNWILLLVGIGGFLVDSFIVIKTKLKK